MKSLAVTVSVSTDDIEDVIAWTTGDTARVLGQLNARRLKIYAEADQELRERLWQGMPASLQWCVHTLERDGVQRLRDVLESAGEPE